MSDPRSTALLIGGDWRAAESDARFPVLNPATGEQLCTVANASVADGLLALTAADQAFASWRSTTPRERSDVLRTAHQLLLERTDEFALLITQEMGKPLTEARGEVSYAADYLRWFSEEASRIAGRFMHDEHGAGQILTRLEPVGPCLLVTPWNFPLAMGSRKVAPALAAGCTCVVKPAEQTPLTMLAFGRLLIDAGVPAGVVNVIPTTSAPEVMAPLIADPRARKLSFTGSTEVGRALIRQGADQVLRMSMELGGNAPFLVLEGADLDAAIDGAMLAKLRNGGQACTSANRFHVHESLAEDFAALLAERMSELVVGSGSEPNVEIGPLIDPIQLEKVAALVDDAVARGAQLLTGGHVLDRAGWFYTPTVLLDPPADSRLRSEEIFGPVAPVTRFTDDSEAIAAANGTPYGLAAYVFAGNNDHALTVASAIEAGMVGINRGVISAAAAPFGGAKSSGFGREGGSEGIAEYLETKYFALP